MWSHFVILAGMRTGSNFLQANLNEYPGLTCLGELFNPHFIDGPGRDELFGVTLTQRDAEPLALIRAARAQNPGLTGFRLFADHDPRVIAAVLADPLVAKVVLSRNPLDSYISRKIAAATGQWRLSDVKNRRRARAEFDPGEFAAHLAGTEAFHAQILRGLQESGQTGFFLDYADVAEVAVMNGLARWLGVTEARRATSTRTRKQNPEPLAEKVANPAVMREALAGLDRFGLEAPPVFEPRRGASVPRFVAGARAPLLYLPLPGTGPESVEFWLAALDRAMAPAGTESGPLLRDFNRKSLRRWREDHPGHRSFTVLRHPLPRLYDAYRRAVLGGEGRDPAALRALLARNWKVRLPRAAGDLAAHRAAFHGFLRFVQASLAGQTPLRVEGAWASQQALVEGMARVILPDHLLRETELARALPGLAQAVGCPALPWAPSARPEGEAPPLEVLADAETRALARLAHQRDFAAFGFAE